MSRERQREDKVALRSNDGEGEGITKKSHVGTVLYQTWDFLLSDYLLSHRRAK